MPAVPAREPNAYTQYLLAGGHKSMPRIAYADESGTAAGTKCYTIGIVTVPEAKESEFEEWFRELKRMHGVNQELKWTRIRRSHGAINCLLDLLRQVMTSPYLTYDSIVVQKELYRNWQGGSAQEEVAFYKTYTLLLRHIARRTKDSVEVYIDDRSDSYPKQHEVVEAIGNNMLAQLQSSGRLTSVTKASSKNLSGIQAADILTGAINAAHQRYLDPKTQLNDGKALAIERLAEMLGWDDLCYDTMPDLRMNIWHFPREYRRVPETLAYSFQESVPYISAGDLE